MTILTNLRNWNFIGRDSDGSVFLYEEDPILSTDGTTWIVPSDARALYLDDSGILNKPVKEYIGVSK